MARHISIHFEQECSFYPTKSLYLTLNRLSLSWVSNIGSAGANKSVRFRIVQNFLVRNFPWFSAHSRTMSIQFQNELRSSCCPFDAEVFLLNFLSQYQHTCVHPRERTLHSHQFSTRVLFSNCACSGSRGLGPEGCLFACLAAFFFPVCFFCCLEQAIFFKQQKNKLVKIWSESKAFLRRQKKGESVQCKNHVEDCSKN